jgi:hypothetical protein
MAATLFYRDGDKIEMRHLPPLRARKFPKTEEFEIGSRTNGETYKVMRIESVAYTCTCPDHRFRQRDCKHIRQVRIF